MYNPFQDLNHIEKRDTNDADNKEVRKTFKQKKMHKMKKTNKKYDSENTNYSYTGSIKKINDTESQVIDKSLILKNQLEYYNKKRLELETTL